MNLHSPPLISGQSHLWQVPLRDESGLRSRQARLLSTDELRRADAFRFDRDRRRFVSARGVLRRLLASYTGLDATKVEIRTTAAGKPFLTQSATPLHFNLSHSGDQAIMAFSRDAELGVDLEEIASEERLMDLTASICTEVEKAQILALPPDHRGRSLLRLWTAKEAYLKATGFGLQIAPHRLEVDGQVLTGSREPSQVRWLEAPRRSELYRLYPLPQCESRLQASAALVIRATATLHQLIWLTVEDGESPLPHQNLPRANAFDAAHAGPRE